MECVAVIGKFNLYILNSSALLPAHLEVPFVSDPTRHIGFGKFVLQMERNAVSFGLSWLMYIVVWCSRSIESLLLFLKS